MAIVQKKKLAIITSHPIQYNAPLFTLLQNEGDIQAKIFYTWSQTQNLQKFDPGFGKVVEWDIPLLQGYDYCFVNNISANPGTHHFNGLVNPTLIDEIEAWGADAVLVFGWSFQSHFKCIRYFHRKKTVLFRGDSTLLDETKGFKIFFRRLFLKWVYRHIDYALFVGTNNKKYFLAHGLNDQQLVYAPHAIDNERFFDEDGTYTEQAMQMRKQLGLKSDDVVLLFAGKLEKKKNPFFLVDLLKRVTEKNIKVVFTGNGALENDLKQAVIDDKRFIFLDFQNQLMMPVIYRISDLFILPSTGPGETWGLALNEAMACGKAVVASAKAGGAIDLIREDENGLILYDNDQAKLLSLIQKAAQDKSVLLNMGKNSKQIIRAFSFQHIVRSIKLVSELLKVKT